MISGPVPDAGMPLSRLASQAWRTIGTASANLMMSRVLACKTTQPQDEYTAATASLLFEARYLRNSLPNSYDSDPPASRCRDAAITSGRTKPGARLATASVQIKTPDPETCLSLTTCARSPYTPRSLRWQSSCLVSSPLSVRLRLSAPNFPSGLSSACQSACLGRRRSWVRIPQSRPFSVGL
jgi:hypothetical protein